MDKKIKVPCLLEVEGLEGLKKTCDEFGLVLTAHGGIVRRIVIKLMDMNESHSNKKVDLFKIMNFGNDIDIIHSGPPEWDKKILASIYKNVYAAECFRWELRSDKSEIFNEAQKCNNFIPVDLMKLSTNIENAFQDPWRGYDDIEEGKYRFIRNGYFKESPLYKMGRSIEIISCLRYLKLLCEMLPKNENFLFKFDEQPGLEVMRKIFDESKRIGIVIAFQESAYLRRSMIYLLKKIYVLSRSKKIYNEILCKSGLDGFFDFLENHLLSFTNTLKYIGNNSLNSVISSSAVGGDVFRLEDPKSNWISGKKAKDRVNETIKGVCNWKEASKQEVKLRCGIETLFASPGIKVQPGAFFIDQSGESEPGDDYEIVEFCIIMNERDEYLVKGCNEEDISILLYLYPGSSQVDWEEKKGILFQPPCTCRICHMESKIHSITVSLNCWRILEGVEEILKEKDLNGKPEVKFFLIKMQ